MSWPGWLPLLPLWDLEFHLWRFSLWALFLHILGSPGRACPDPNVGVLYPPAKGQCASLLEVESIPWRVLPGLHPSGGVLGGLWGDPRRTPQDPVRRS